MKDMDIIEFFYVFKYFANFITSIMLILLLAIFLFKLIQDIRKESKTIPWSESYGLKRDIISLDIDFLDLEDMMDVKTRLKRSSFIDPCEKNFFLIMKYGQNLYYRYFIRIEKFYSDYSNKYLPSKEKIDVADAIENLDYLMESIEKKKDMLPQKDYSDYVVRYNEIKKIIDHCEKFLLGPVVKKQSNAKK